MEANYHMANTNETDYLSIVLFFLGQITKNYSVVIHSPSPVTLMGLTLENPQSHYNRFLNSPQELTLPWEIPHFSPGEATHNPNLYSVKFCNSQKT